MPRPSRHCAPLVAVTVVLLCFAAAHGQTSLGDFENGLTPWNFGRGSEFPGASGSADIVTRDAHSGKSALQITGDFTGGGRYVHITRQINPAVEPGPVELWVKSDSLDYLMLRFVDESGQTFQPQIKLAKQPGWQKLTIAQLNSGQHWGAPGSDNDGKWHGKLKLITVLFEKQAIAGDTKKAVVLLDDIQVLNGQTTTNTAPVQQQTPSPAADNKPGIAAGETDGFENGPGNWQFSNGGEFKGAMGAMEITDAQFRTGTKSLKLAGDFSGGGRYVQAYRSVTPPVDATGLSLWVKPHDLTYILIRTEDQTGQTFQHRIKVEPTDNWQQVKLERMTAAQKWGGANDGKWHGPLTKLAIMLEKQGITDNGASAWLHIDDISLIGKDGDAQSRLMRLPVPLGDFSDGLTGWWPLSGNNVDVKLKVDSQTGVAAPGALRADANFTSGGGSGGWVSLMRQMDQEFDIGAMSFQIKAENLKAVNVVVMTRTGQNFSRPVRIAEPGQWQLVELGDLPIAAQATNANDSKLFGAAVAIRIAYDANQRIDTSKPATTLWLDDAHATAVGPGVLYVPGASLRAGDGMVGRIETVRSVPVYWGPSDKPESVKVLFVNASDKPVKTPAVRLLDHALRPITTLYAGGEPLAPGATFDKQLPLNLTRFGHYTIAAAIAGKPLTASLAWFAAEGRPDPDGKFGIHEHLSQGPWGRGQYLDGGEGVIALTRKLGAGWIREDIRGHFDNNDQLTGTDRRGYFGWADPAKAEGLSMIGTYFDFLHNGKPPSDDASRARYAKRFAQLVKHYGDAVRVFEVWNEPNISPGWRGEPNPDDYAAMLKAAYPAIKQADPAAVVLGVTSAGTDFAFIEKVLADGAAPCMDAISVHPYHSVAPEIGNSHMDPPPVWMGTGGHIDFVKRIGIVAELLTRNGGSGKPIWGTEMGGGSKDPDTEWLDTCHLIRQYMLGMALPQLRMMVAYNFQDQGYNENDASGMTFGFFRANGMPEPHAVAYNTMTRVLHKKQFAGRIDLGDGIFCCRFTGEGDDVLALWSVDQGLTASFATQAAQITLVDLMGNPRKVAPIDGRVTLAATGEPVFVVGAGIVSKAAPLLTLTAADRATSEDDIAVKLQRATALPPLLAGALSGEAVAGWRAVSSGNDEVIFKADDDIRNGQYALIVRAGQMSAATSVTLRNGIQLTTASDSRGHVIVTATNPFPHERKIVLRPTASNEAVKWGEKQLLVPPHSQSSLTLDVPGQTAMGWRTTVVTLNASLPAGQAGYLELPADGDHTVAGVTPWYAITPAVDGRLDDWQACEPCVMDQPSMAVPVGRFAKANWRGVDDLSAKFRVGSDASAMYLAISVRDDRRVADFPVDQMWKGDCVQLAMLIGEARYEFTIALDDAGKVRVRQDSPVKRTFEQAAGAGVIAGNDCTMEVALPWQAMGVGGAPQSPSKFALLVNDNDGKNDSAQAGRKGYLQWFAGIGENKDPQLYGPVVFRDVTAMR